MNKEQLRVGDYLQSNSGQFAFVDRIFNDKTRVWINNQREYISDEELKHWSFGNPIKDNRIVSSKTFAVRFKQFLEWIPGDFRFSGPHIAEEFEYLMDIANRLLKYQIQTVTEEEEINYLKRLELL